MNNNNPFETIQQWLTKNSMTVAEKRQMKQALVSYVTTHPVKSGLLSPYMFRYATLALASLIIVLGGSVGITKASMSALPNQKLYAMKLWIEDYQSNNQKTPENKIAYEAKRIKTRFDEASKLAIHQKLDVNTSSVIESGIEHSRDAINDIANTISATNPELALSATNNLETTFSSNGKILAAIGKNTGQDLGKIILGTEVTAKKLALEKTKFEQIVAMKSNDDSKAAAIAKLAIIEARLPKDSEASMTATSATALSATASNATSATSTATAIALTASTPTSTAGTAKIALPTPAVPVTEDLHSAKALVIKAKKQMADGAYSDALVTLQKAEQILDEENLTEKLESTYQVKVQSNTSASTNTTTDATAPGTSTSSPTSAGTVPPTTPSGTTSTPVIPADAGASAQATTETAVKKPL